MKAELRAKNMASLQNPSLFKNIRNHHQQSSSLVSGALQGCLGTLDGACIEKLLVHCASSLEENDVTLAQQVMWVLNNVASTQGDPNQRLTSWFLRALIFRASRICPNPNPPMNFNGGFRRKLMSVTELAGYVDLIPWHRFGFCASNSAIFRAIRGCPKVHILDFSITHCMQWPTLIDALAKRPEGPPVLRITVPGIRPLVPPMLNVSIEEIGLRLGNFAKFRDVPFEFNIMQGEFTLKESSSFQFQSILNHLNNPSSLNLSDDETLVINCQNWIRFLPDDDQIRDTFLDIVKTLNPRIIIIVDEDCDLNTSSLTSRIRSCFNYLWIPLDALETFLPKESGIRMEYETDIGHKIENIVGLEGIQRIERQESGSNFSQRMKNNGGFISLPFCEDTIKEVKFLLDEHASGWGMKREDDMLVLTWKGHNSVFATAWVQNNNNNCFD